jgi:predicted KAP-like P-loop ATPase
MANAQSPLTVGADRPLADPREDLLGYAPFAKQLAHTLLRNSPAEGFVIAIYGTWGTGKSSALNFVVHYMEEDPDADAPVIIRFNPWWFAGGDDLVRRFFAQFETAVFASGAKKKKLKAAFERFASAVGEVPFAPLQAAGKVAVAAARAVQTTDVVKLKEELSAQLAKQALRIIVIMDDIDRLVADEVRQLFRLIKAVADFPNVTYLLAFDRESAAAALDELHAGRGAAYLEKIVQAPFELPMPDRTHLRALFVQRLNQVLGELPEAELDPVYWMNIFMDGIDPFIRTPRDVVRLSNVIAVTFPGVKGEVNVVDFIAIETLRVFCPPAYDVIRSNQEHFASAFNPWTYSQAARTAASTYHDGWMSSLGAHREQVRRLVFRLFPQVEGVFSGTGYAGESLLKWRRGRHVCSPEFFSVYFRFALPPGSIARAEFDGAIAAQHLPALAAKLRHLAAEKQADGTTRARFMLDRLSDHARDRTSKAAEIAPVVIAALFETGDDIIKADSTQSSVFDLDDSMRVHFTLQNFLKRLQPPQRLALLRPHVERGRALGVIVRFVFALTREIGKDDGNVAAAEDHMLELVPRA